MGGAEAESVVAVSRGREVGGVVVDGAEVTDSGAVDCLLGGGLTSAGCVSSSDAGDSFEGGLLVDEVS